MYECEPAPLGWWAGAFFVFVAVFGGLLLPTVLIGVISIAFDESRRHLEEEKAHERAVEKILAHAEQWGDDFVTEDQVYNLRVLFEALQDDEAGRMSEENAIAFLSYVCATYLTPASEDHLRGIYREIDLSGNSVLDFPEFLWFLLFLKRKGVSARDPGETKRRSSFLMGGEPAPPPAPPPNDEDEMAYLRNHSIGKETAAAGASVADDAASAPGPILAGPEHDDGGEPASASALSRAERDELDALGAALPRTVRTPAQLARVRRLLDAMAREPFVADGAPLVALVEAIGAEIDVVFDDEGDEKDAAGDGGDDARGEDTDSEYTDDEDVEKGAFCGPGGADGAANPVGDCGAGSRKGASSVFSW